MAVRFILTEYVNQAMVQAVYDKLEDGTFAGRIPPCKGVLAFSSNLTRLRGRTAFHVRRLDFRWP